MKGIVIGLLIVGLTGTHEAVGQLPAGDLVVQHGSLTFNVHATLVGGFVGKTDSVMGEFHGGPDIVAAAGWVETPVTSLRTGNGKRDKDMRRAMQATDHPTVRFDLTRASVLSAESRDTVPLVLHGTFELRGVARPVDLPAVAVIDGSAIHVHSDFAISMHDYTFPRLTKLMGTIVVHDSVQVHADLELTSAMPH
jgi:polyisoprenoid-binding protein YceI